MKISRCSLWVSNLVTVSVAMLAVSHLSIKRGRGQAGDGCTGNGYMSSHCWLDPLFKTTDELSIIMDPDNNVHEL